MSWVLVLIAIGLLMGTVLTTVARQRQDITPYTVAGVVLIVFLVLTQSVRVVPAGHVGVVDLFGKVSPQTLPSGIALVNPLARVIPLSIQTQEDKETMSVPSKEGLNVALEISILYRLKPEKAAEIYRTVGKDYLEVVLIPQSRSVARDVTVANEAKALYTSEREVIAQKFHDYLQQHVEERGIVIESILLRSITLPPMVSQAIEQKLKAEQDAERMKFVLQKEQQEAERKRVEAAGIRDAQAIINQSLTSQYLNYLWINTLNQNPNVIYVATEANMPLFRVLNPDEQLKQKKPLLDQEKK